MWGKWAGRREKWSVRSKVMSNEEDLLFIAGERVRSVWDYEPGGLHARVWCTCGLTFVLLLAVILTRV